MNRHHLFFAITMAMVTTAASAGVVTLELSKEIARRKSGERIPIIIQMADRVIHDRLGVKNRHARDNALLRALKEKAERTQRPIDRQLDQHGASNKKQLWLINAIAVTVPVSAIDELARNPAIGRIQFDAIVPFSATANSASASAGWNLSALRVPDLWALGQSGNGAVVANMDTGVDADHPDLSARWRGGANSWFDPYNEHPTPYDFSGHGTQTMGLMVGGSESGMAIGMAPDARWIAAKIYNDAGQGTLSGIHRSFQWLMDPDENPATIDAPDVVNAAWGLAGSAPGACNLEFNEDIQALNAAGIAVVLAAGNDGPWAATSASPANNPAGYAVGAIDESLAIDYQSSRGPSGCDGKIFPDLTAPGVNVVTSDLSFGGLPLYVSVSGTSFASSHLAGVMALLAVAFPAASMTELREALTDSAQNLGVAGADNTFGHGLVDALAAHNLLATSQAAASVPQTTPPSPSASTKK